MTTSIPSHGQKSFGNSLGHEQNAGIFDNSVTMVEGSRIFRRGGEYLFRDGGCSFACESKPEEQYSTNIVKK
jgi:hypothetical protein